jgi:choloylglycine hydrolase
MNFILLTITFFILSIFPCTQFFLRTKNENNMISGRNLDFPNQLDCKIASQKKDSPLPFHNQDHQENSKYNYVYTYGLENKAFALDGQNEENLVIQALWQDTSTYTDKKTPDSYMILDLMHLVLGKCKTIKEVKELLKNITFYTESIALSKTEKLELYIHFVVYNNKEQSIIIEFNNGIPVIHENIFSVLTNTPNYSFHCDNMIQYANLNNKSIPLNKKYARKNNRFVITGNGFCGLPGDGTPPSRFVRTAKTIEFVDPQDTAGTIILADRIISHMTAVGSEKLTYMKDDKYLPDLTQMTLLIDVEGQTWYIKDQNNINYTKINISEYWK